MKTLKLAQEVLEVLWRYDLDGSYIYVPVRKSPTLVGDFTPKVLLEIEATYEERGVTFYWEASPRKVLSGMFGKRMVASMFNLKLRTAASVVSAAYKAWREWFSHHERPRLEQLRRIAEESGREYTPLYFSYLEIRSMLRNKQEVTANYYARRHTIPNQESQQIIDLAQSSIESCRWRSS
jgi:hypothetical protein